MRILKKLLSILTVTSVLPFLSAGKPAETQNCVISGDLWSEGIVEIGINVPAWVTLDEDGNPTGIWVSQNLLNDFAGNFYIPAGFYMGHTRVLKKQPRTDFEFAPDGAACVSPVYGDVPPYWSDGDGLCPYRLVILDGFYDRQADTVTYDEFARVLLVDYSLGTPCSQVPEGDPCVDNYQVGAGPVSSEGILFAFQTDGGDAGPDAEKGGLCKDGVDNDGDSQIDCEDPDCAKWCG